MKQIDIIRTYAQKRCLVVEKNPESRSNIKRLLIDFGVVSVDTAGKAEEALELCQRYRYDLVISEYHLGVGKNGQHLLEELRLHQWLSLKALFILISADGNVHDVLHAIENQPDDFISKPINKISLRPRLDQALLKSEALNEIKEKLEEGQTEAVIKQCKDLIAQNSKYQNDVRRILAETYINQNAWELAANTFNQANTYQKSNWADIGLAKVLLQECNFDAAKKIILLIIKDQPLCVEAMDLLAEIYEKQEQPELAQQTLEKALAATPKSVSRNRNIGRISIEISDFQRAAHAYRNVTKLSKNSSIESPSDYLNLATTLQEIVANENNTNTTNNNEDSANELIKEATQALKSAEKKSHQHPLVNINRKLIAAKLMRLQKNTDSTDQLVLEAITLLNSMNPNVATNSCPRLCIDCATNFISLNEHICGERLLKYLNRDQLNQHLNNKIDTLLQKPILEEGSLLANKQNKKGIKYYEENKLDEAIGIFTTILNYLPNHASVKLNLIQALIRKDKVSTLDTNQLKSLKNCFKSLNENPNITLSSNRYDYLKKHYEKIISKNSINI